MLNTSMEHNSTADILKFDLYALTSKENIPVYRVFIDGFLMTERDYRADSFANEYVRETSPILLLKYPTQLKIEWHKQPFNYEVKNIRLDRKTVKDISIVEQDRDIFIADIHHIV